VPGNVNFYTSAVHALQAHRGHLELRWDAFNLFSHPGIGFLNANIGNATAGRVTTTFIDDRSMRFARKMPF